MTPSFSTGKRSLQCMLVFTKNVIIVAFLGKWTQMVAVSTRYGPFRRWLSRQEHKPASTILNKYKSWVIPYSSITEMNTAGTGRIRKRAFLRIRTAERVYDFGFTVSRETLDEDMSQLLNKAGAKFSQAGFDPGPDSSAHLL